MPKFSMPSTRKSRRYSSESGSLSPPALSSHGATDPARPSSSSRLLHKPTGGASINEVLDYNNRLPKPPTTTSARRPSDHANTRPQDLNENAANRNRWSSSTASSTSASHHRRHSSFSKRFSLGTSSLNSGFRSLSPNKMHRPGEASSYQTTAATSETSATSLPSINGFSPITLPNMTYGSVDKSKAPTRQLPAPPTASSKSSALHAARGGDGMSNGATSPMKKHRDMTSRGGSHLSDIMEIDRSIGSSSSPRAQMSSGSPRKATAQERSRSRRGNSRDTSPVKYGSETSRPGTQGSTQSTEMSPNGVVRKRSKKDKDKKIILSRALKRANEAVLLDNEQSYIQAVTAYEEACGLLDLVMERTHAETERAKLTSIRGTYLSRIQELKHIQTLWVPPDQGEFGLANVPEVPIRESLDGELGDRAYGDFQPSTVNSPSRDGNTMRSPQLSSPPTAHEQIFGSQPLTRHISETITPAFKQNEERYLPPPLSPRRSPTEPTSQSTQPEMPPSKQDHQISQANHTQQSSTSDAGSWFNPGGDDLVSSGHSRNHSISSIEGVRRKDLRTQALSTEAEFDAALDAAIESAYPDGFEPYEDDEYGVIGLATSPPSRIIDPLGDQAQSYAQRQENIQRLSSQRSRNPNDSDTIDVLSEIESGIDSEEEDRLLDVGRETANGQENDTKPEVQPQVPRQSDSSGFSANTWGSSAASSLNTAGTSLGTVDENASLPSLPSKKYNPKSPPSQGPEAMPLKRHESHLSDKGHGGEESEATRSRSPLRERRLSAQKAKGQLRIETSVSTEASPDRSKQHDRAQPPETTKPEPSQDTQVASPTSTGSAQARAAFRQELNRTQSPFPSSYVGAFPQDVGTPPTPSLRKTLSNESGTQPGSPFASPPRKAERPQVMQNISSMSLGKHVLQGGRTPDEPDESNGPLDFTFPASMSPPQASMSPQQSHEAQLGQPLSTPLDTTFGSPPAVTSAKMKIFDNEIHSSLPGAPNPDLSDAPKTLEPCPESTLLRPFWLMRCFHQTLGHPKGGYVTTKLFVPHDVWKVKNVKLKSVEEKIANCDLLTAALLKLSSVDTLDADAVLEEMQSFETVLDQAQTNLSKKLGNEVGVNGVSTLFKEASTASSPPSVNTNASNTGTEGNTNTTSTGGKTSSKGYLSSWRKLRSKSSSTNLTTGHTASREQPKEGMTMSSLPMTNGIGAQRSIGKRHESNAHSLNAAEIDGPNANYAGALARLCDAAQVLDQIARQVEDPGLKLSSPTHVGLELSTRHAAEFFGFYVCRFILQDLTMLTEKFVKRASEWVVA